MQTPPLVSPGKVSLSPKTPQTDPPACENTPLVTVHDHGGRRARLDPLIINTIYKTLMIEIDI
jgi:hypothetical protein